MQKEREQNIALFIDYDNVALGARDAGRKFDIQVLLHKVLDRGKIIIKRAYADWHHYKDQLDGLHQAAIELIEVPSPRISGKNSADIRLVVDAMDLCFSKDHIDTFVIVSGDSDFSPLVSKLRENNKRVVGVGMKNSSSKLLIGNCDEFLFFDDLIRSAAGRLGGAVSTVPQDKRAVFEFLLETARALLQESRGNLYSSLIKDTMKRKRPDFNEGEYGYSTFGDLLEDARRHGLLEVIRDNHAGGTWVVVGLGKEATAAAARQPRRRSRGGRGRGGKRRPAASEKQAVVDGDGISAEQPPAVEKESAGKPAVPKSEKPRREKPKLSTGKRGSSPLFVPGPVSDGGAPAVEEKQARKPTKKVAAGAARKMTKKVTKKAPKKVVKKAPKTAVKKTVKKVVKKTAKKKTSKKTTKSSTGQGAE